MSSEHIDEASGELRIGGRSAGWIQYDGEQMGVTFPLDRAPAVWIRGKLRRSGIAASVPTPVMNMI
jgi:hypothetical protein